MSKDRDAFEKFAAAKHGSNRMTKYDDGSYEFELVNEDFKVWQAARAAEIARGY